jgi:ABC-2 type transport system permease protein
MLVLSGLFFPLSMLPPVLQAVSKVLPLTYAVSLLSGIWRGDGWSAHALDIAALLLTFLACTALSARVFRWE